VAELPEVETMRRDLQRELAGRRVERAVVAQTRMLGGQDPEELRRRLEGRIVGDVARRGKFLLLSLDSGDVLLVHRGMTGNLFLKRPGDPPDAHLHLAAVLDDGRELRVCDHRGFGEVRVISAEQAEALSQRLGPEPLGPEFTAEYLAAQLARRTALIKALLLNQSIVAGLGNIYVDEALWAAKIHPERRANTLCSSEVEALQAAIVRVIGESIERRGTTFSDYKDLYGQPGGNSRHLHVFHRVNAPCPRCGTPIQMVRAAGRGSSVCLVCQPPPGR
jgi:formamidopyrimidine-DNA glycosylase